MKRALLKKISAVLVTTAVLFTTVFSVSICVSATSVSFTPRLSAPSGSNSYYYSSKNIFYSCGYGMPNCTAYAYGRAYEILGSEPNLSWNGAGKWYNDNRSSGAYDYGKTPKVGAIACWSYSGGGHVAVVEEIDSYGNMTLSNSAWQGTNFYLTYAHTSDSNPGGNSWWTFQGYIYLIDSSEEPEPATEAPTTTVPPTTVAPTTVKPTTAPTTVPARVDTTSSYKTGIYQVTGVSYLNARSGAGLSYNVVTSATGNAVLTVTNTAYVDGYNWGYTTVDGMRCWVALEYCQYVSATKQPTTAPATTVPATTVPATTTAPATVAPTTAAPTTVPATTTAPATVASTTAPKLKHAGRGDVDGDGVISIIDATLIQQHLAGMVTLPKSKLKWADLNMDGAVSVEDATTLQRALLNK